MSDAGRRFLAKAEANRAAAESEFAAGRYDSCANCAYYAGFQAAIAALLDAGVQPPDRWGHDFVQARFAGDLVNRRHLYPPDLREALPLLFSVRQQADYEPDPVTEKHASRAMRRMRVFVQAVAERIA